MVSLTALPRAMFSNPFLTTQILSMNRSRVEMLLSLVLALVLVPMFALGQPTVTTNNASSITTTSSQLNGSVLSPALSSTAHFDWGTTITYGNVTPNVIVGAASVPVPISANLSGLLPNTMYHFRATAFNDDGTGDGGDKLFTTSAAAPTVVTSPPQNVTFSSVRLVSTVNPNNSATDTHFDWGTSIAYGSTTPISSLPADMVTHSETFDLGTLSPNTMYHYRISATNVAGTVNGGDQSFTTPPIAPLPTATTLAPQDVSPNSAKLVGTVNPNGAATTSYFKWWGPPHVLYGDSTSIQSVGDGTSAVQMNFAIGGLAPSSQYHYRIVATNLGGTVSGNDQFFTTPAIGPSQVPLLTPWGGVVLAISFAASVLLIRRTRRRLSA